MTIYMAACSKRAYALMRRLEEGLRRAWPDSTLVCRVKCSGLAEISEKQSLTECVGTWFGKADAIVFLCAAGIAVRAIAPYLKHKSEDPAVVVLDETGKFCISLLSGHTGGANRLAEVIAGLLGAIPVITTATDREGKFAVDEFARQNGLAVTDWRLAKELSVRVLDGERLALLTELLAEGTVPDELKLIGLGKIRDELKPIEPGEVREGGLCPEECPDREIRAGIYVSCQSKRLTLPEGALPGGVLQLVPRDVAAGIGCRKGTAAEEIALAVEQCLREEGIHPEAVFAAASITLKKEEPGLLAYCRDRRLPFLTYTPEELRRVPGSFSSSDFVEQVTGVGNVCERSAVAAAGGRLLSRKKVYGGVTVALAGKERKLCL